MKNLSTLSAIGALALASFGAQAQFTVDGTLSPIEVGTGPGKYQLVGAYTGAHNQTDRGLKFLYVGTTATALNIMVVASAETADYNSLVLYLDTPNRTGIAANAQLPGSTNAGNNGRESLRQRPTLDMPVDFAFRCTTSPFLDANNAIYLSRVNYTMAPYDEVGMGAGRKDGSLTTDSNDPALAKTAYQTSATGSVAANTTTGWELEMPLAALGGAATGSDFKMMVAFIDDFRSFNVDVLPTIVGRTTALGIDPDLAAIAGNQHYTYRVGTGVLASRSAGAALQAAAYPNPLAATSRLAYTVPTAAQPVAVDVFNSLGQKALSLLNTTQAAGAHAVDLSALRRLAAGSYVVTLRVGSQLSTHRVMVE
ncbi:T9SS type A sorting domain-containing protein [Hymenobacter sp.]|uniref:T9SS type A sorting domain-containing protein n=1 Tax=Hymenobacter sp. TaxID=1898978 RepID=UPI00286A6FB9|nr:T9SS type A sorting domain-containing protein [Hymenobacter sp.]